MATTTNYGICTGNGGQITAGLQGHNVWRVARREADERGESVFVFEMPSPTGAEPIEVSPAAGTLRAYESGVEIRPAQPSEMRASREAAIRDGGAGVITVDGHRCYVED